MLRSTYNYAMLGWNLSKLAADALQPVHIDGKLVTGTFPAEYDAVIESLCDNGLIEPVFSPPPTVDVPCWEVDHLEA